MQLRHSDSEAQYDGFADEDPMDRISLPVSRTGPSRRNCDAMAFV